jgi:hypothetical protein
MGLAARGQLSPGAGAHGQDDHAAHEVCVLPVRLWADSLLPEGVEVGHCPCWLQSDEDPVSSLEGGAPGDVIAGHSLVARQGGPSSPPLLPVSYEGNLSPDSFEVDHIVTHRGPPAKREYIIRWKGFAPEYDSWVADGDINALECVTQYWQTQGRQGRATPHPRTGGRVTKREVTPAAPAPNTTRAPAKRRCRRTGSYGD